MQKLQKRAVAVSEAGRVIGEDHPRSKLSNADVEEIRDLLEHGALGTRRIAMDYGVSRALVRAIGDYSRRRQVTLGVRQLVIEGKVWRTRRTRAG